MDYRKFIIFLFVGLFLTSGANAFVEAFSQFDTTYTLNFDNTLTVEKNLKLQNIHDQAIIPGQVEFKIVDKQAEFNNNFKLEDYKATNRYGEEIRSRVINTNEGVIIILEIVTPVLPGFESVIDLEYNLSYDPKGILFKSLEIPLNEKLTIAKLNGGKVKLNLPENRHLTFLGYKDESTIVSENSIEWNIGSKDVPETVQFEYSRLPVSFGRIRGSLVFWSVINLLLILVLALQIRRILKNKK
ncbi:MAG: hypothetical protein ACOCXG_00755 [Nanoarchaeota archaeon]